MTEAPGSGVPYDTLPVRLLILRKEKGWSQRVASEKTGVPFGTWQGMESGERETRGLDRHIAAISKATGYKREWLMWGGALTPTPPGSGPGTLRSSEDPTTEE